MNCAVCGKDNQAGTRFCVHCGAALAAPRPVAPATAATSTGTTTIVRPAPTLGPDTVTRAAAAFAPDAAGASGAPAYDTAAPGSGGKVLFAIGVAALVIAAGFVGYKIFGGSAEVKDSFAKFDAPAAPREAAPPPSARPAEPPPAPPEPAKVEDKAAVLPVDAMKSEAPKTEAPKAQAEADKAKGSSARIDAKSETKSDAKAPVKTPGGAASAMPGAAPAPSASAPAARAQPPAPAQVAPPPAAPVQDHWAQMAAAQRECQKENVFARVICDQKVRMRYCRDHWGTLPQCPGAVANPDKGQ
ncbi:MAG: hypothetical protein ABW276_10190 [Casimicrobiaceae bacterium]